MLHASFLSKSSKKKSPFLQPFSQKKWQKKKKKLTVQSAQRENEEEEALKGKPRGGGFFLNIYFFLLLLQRRIWERRVYFISNLLPRWSEGTKVLSTLFFSLPRALKNRMGGPHTSTKGKQRRMPPRRHFCEIICRDRNMVYFYIFREFVCVYGT